MIQPNKMSEGGLKLYERMRLILEFFATATGNSDSTSNFTMVIH